MNDQEHVSSRWMKPYLIVIIMLLALGIGLDLYKILKDKMDEDQGKSPLYSNIVTLLAQNKYEQVITLCETDLKKNPENQDAWWGKAEALYHLGKWQESERAFRKAKELMPAWSEEADRFLAIIKEKSATSGKKDDGVPITGSSPGN